MNLCNRFFAKILQVQILVLFLWLCLHPVSSIGQAGTNSYGKISVEITKFKKPKKIAVKVFVLSAFPGGDSVWMNRLEKNLSQSIAYRNGAKKGKYNVEVIFIVSKDGSISDIRSVTDPGFGMTEEVIRAIKKSPKWLPAAAPGIKVRNRN